MLTLAEYLEDYAPEATAKKGWELIKKNLEVDVDPKFTPEVKKRLERIRAGERDLYF